MTVVVRLLLSSMSTNRQYLVSLKELFSVIGEFGLGKMEPMSFITHK